MGLIFLVSSLATALNAQMASQGGSREETTQSSSLEGTQNQQDSTQGEQEGSSFPSPQSRSSLPGASGESSRAPNGNYSDIEQFTRQNGARNQTQWTPLPPEPLTEFQKFTASTTGQALPIYGSNLFSSVPSTFAPLDLTPVPLDYIVGPGDELRIRAWGQVNFQINVRVDRSGEVFLPQVGPVHVAGMAFSALGAHLRGAVGRVYRNFDLTVDVGQIRAIQVYVSGEARRPGVYTVSSLSTLVDALFASGGPSVQGSMRRVQLRREGALVTEFDLYELLMRGDKSKDVKLQSGDVILIPAVGPQAAVTGSVRNPAIYELKENESLSGLLANAGGVSSVASEARVSIERIEDHRDRFAMEVAYDASGLATAMADGDLVRVFSIVPIYRKTVILRGNTANPGRFAWHAGMRLSELIPDKESLMTRNYWWKRSQAGLPAPEFEPAPGFANQRQPADNHAITLQFPTQEETSASTSGAGLLPAQNLSAQQRAGGSSLAAQQAGVSTRVVAPAQRTEIRAFAPEIDWDYAVIQRLDPETMKAVLIPFDLGKLVLQHDASQDLELQAGDVVSVFSEADIRVPLADQTKSITLDGEFIHAGVYTAQPGETLRHLVERAGGLTPNAYLYASEFARLSTRALQQARIDEYVQTLSMAIQRSSLALASSSSSASQDLTSGAPAQSSERDIIASLRQIRATGRIVLRFTPNSSGVDSLPDIPLEDGDRFVVPSVPATVNVVGSVYDQNSFLYQPGRRAGTYLRQAGGANRDADRGHEFIIRADGEVVSRDKSKSFWGNEFDNLRIYPGDTIMVPEKTFKPSALRDFTDWSQMFSQFALGAAALSVLK
jgi:protein involved in polysaccharide export with SLBB domain